MIIFKRYHWGISYFSTVGLTAWTSRCLTFFSTSHCPSRWPSERVSGPVRVRPEGLGSVLAQRDHGRPSLLHLVVSGKGPLRPAEPRQPGLPPPAARSRGDHQGHGQGEGILLSLHPSIHPVQRDWNHLATAAVQIQAISCLSPDYNWTSARARWRWGAIYRRLGNKTGPDLRRRQSCFATLCKDMERRCKSRDP